MGRPAEEINKETTWNKAVRATPNEKQGIRRDFQLDVHDSSDDADDLSKRADI